MGFMDNLSNLAKEAQEKAQEIAAKVKQRPALSPAQHWLYTTDGKKKYGPVSFDQLKINAEAGQLLPSSMVHLAGMQTWLEARQFKALWDAFPDAFPADAPFTHTVSRKGRDVFPKCLDSESKLVGEATH
jgi:hypothetical protein